MLRSARRAAFSAEREVSSNSCVVCSASRKCPASRLFARAASRAFSASSRVLASCQTRISSCRLASMACSSDRSARSRSVRSSCSTASISLSRFVSAAASRRLHHGGPDYSASRRGLRPLAQSVVAVWAAKPGRWSCWWRNRERLYATGMKHPYRREPCAYAPRLLPFRLGPELALERATSRPSQRGTYIHSRVFRARIRLESHWELRLAGRTLRGRDHPCGLYMGWAWEGTWAPRRSVQRLAGTPSKLPSEFDGIGREPLFVVTVPRHLAPCRAVLTERRAGAALGDAHRVHDGFDTGAPGRRRLRYAIRSELSPPARSRPPRSPASSGGARAGWFATACSGVSVPMASSPVATIRSTPRRRRGHG